MNQYVVVIFPDETKAYEGVRALNELHQEGTLTVYATVVAERRPDGSLNVKQKNDAGPVGLGVGAMLGALAGLFAGPVGVAFGLAAGSVAGGSIDLLEAGVSHEFLQEVRRDLSPGKFVVVAEVSEDWLAPLDMRMEALGGSIIRERRVAFVDHMLEQKANARQAEFARWKQERALEKAQRLQTRLTAALERAQEKLEHTAEETRERLDQTKEELQAKLHALEEQAAKTKPEARARIALRIAELRSDFAEREQKLTRAYQLTREALAAASNELRP